MIGSAKWAAYVGAALLGLVIYWALTQHTDLQPPIPFGIAMLFVIIDVSVMRWLFQRGADPD